MSAEEVFSFRQQYGNRMRQLLQAGAESASHALHAELLKLVALWVRPPQHLGSNLWGTFPLNGRALHTADRGD